MEDQQFKFEPVWVSVLTTIPLFCIYKAYSEISKQGFIFSFLFPILVMPFVIIGAPLLIMGIKMLTGVPAIVLTTDQLVDNVVGITIDWANISNIQISGVKKPFLNISLKDKNKFYSSVNPVKRILLKVFFAIGPGDVSVNLAFVAGNNEYIASLTRVYWSKYYGQD